MADASRPSRNPANDDSLAGAFQEILGKFLESVDDMLPAVVIAYDRDTNRATVKPMIRVLQTDGTLIDRAEVASVPVFMAGGGNVVLTFNLEPGDLGWLKANDRDTSLFLQSESNSPPNTLRKHSFSDAVFIPDQLKKWTLNAEDSANAVLQTLDGSQRIAIFDTKIKITSDTLLDIVAPDIAILGDLIITGAAAVTSTLIVGGNLFSFGTVTGLSDVLTIGGITLGTHKHVGSATAPVGPIVNTGTPVP